MTNTTTRTRWPLPRSLPALLWASAVLWSPSIAQAQGSACEQLKATLAARIEATGVRGYSLEAVPASTPVPAGAKVIGNCEGGERKMLYRRFGGASAAASAPAVAQEPPPKRQTAPARVDVPVAVAASVPVPAPKPAPVQAVAPEPAKAEPVASKEIEPVRVVESAPPPPPPPPPPAASAVLAVPVEPGVEGPTLLQRASAFAVGYWPWLLALFLVPLGVVGWAWRAHHLAYDKNGLPRGPRL